MRGTRNKIRPKISDFYVSGCLILLMLTLLPACSVLPKRTDAPKNSYVLRMAQPWEKACPRAVGGGLIVALPGAAPGLDTARMARMDGDGQLRYEPRARWAGPLPEVVQATMVDALEQSGCWRTVGSDEGGFAADMVLSSDIREFHRVVVDGEMKASVVIAYRLTDASTRRVVLNGTTKAQEALLAETGGMTATVFAKATRQALTQMVAAIGNNTP